MNSSLLFLLAFMGGSGGGISQAIVQAMMDARKDSFERWSKLLQSLGMIITTGIFFLRGMPAPVDSAGNPIFTPEALSKQMAAGFTEGKREAFWVAVVNGIVAALTEFLRPSSVENALFASMLKPATATTTTTVIQPPSIFGTAAATAMPQATTITRTAGSTLRNTTAPGSFIRAQAVFFNPQTGEMVVE